MFGSHQRMDVAELERVIEQDKNTHRVPLMVLADAGIGIKAKSTMVFEHGIIQFVLAYYMMNAAF